MTGWLQLVVHASGVKLANCDEYLARFFTPFTQFSKELSALHANGDHAGRWVHDTFVRAELLLLQTRMSLRQAYSVVVRSSSNDESRVARFDNRQYSKVGRIVIDSKLLDIAGATEVASR